MLLILAGVSIALLTGENGILTQASTSEVKTVHSAVLEAMRLEYQSYVIDKKIEATTKSFIQTLTDKEIITNDTEEGKYIIDIEKLMNKKTKYGNGTNGTDIYKLEEIVETIGKLENIKIASTTSVKIAETSTEKRYKVVYYGKTSTDRIEVGNITNSSTIATNPNDNTDGINWEQKKATAKKHPSQKNTNDIGLDAKGNAINLDLWCYKSGALTANEIQLENFNGCGDGSCYYPLLEGWENSELYSADIDLENIVCPQYIKLASTGEWLPVTTMFAAFNYCSGIKSLVLPSTLKEIDSGNFSGCTSLESMNIPETCTIASGAFEDCPTVCPHREFDRIYK